MQTIWNWKQDEPDKLENNDELVISISDESVMSDSTRTCQVKQIGHQTKENYITNVVEFSFTRLSRNIQSWYITEIYPFFITIIKAIL